MSIDELIKKEIELAKRIAILKQKRENKQG